MVTVVDQRRSRSRPFRNDQRGYTLVAVAVIVTVLSIAVAMVLPAWSAQIQREREEELVFRGLQYAEGIRVFQRRFGRFPNTLTELMEVKPRSIRRLWSEPLTDNGTWQPILLAPPGQPDGGGQVGADGRPLPPEELEPDGDGGGATASAGAAPAGPIIGVRSTNSKTGFRTFFGQDAYNQWRFTYDLVTPGGGISLGGDPAALSPATGLARIPRAEWIGRPLPGASGAPPLPGQPGQPDQGPGGAPSAPANPPRQGDDDEP